MLAKIAIWYLRKTKKSVLIGFEIKDGYLRSLNNNTLTYDNHLVNVDYRTRDDKPLLLPEGKFSISRKDNA
ncbi:hypothetical protein D5F11_009015 [Siminovitchia terrae]|uniref:Uncharacterized protein n=1 Tax=Siminovitchia terrae TaxID=1914933 RepID=A0A429X9N2_SIMTE|nr:hypothetical protein [Siminovitchia terrae]RST60187.1 hypothetical protein D5F11_009015 [Siminovitchia terrae]